MIRRYSRPAALHRRLRPARAGPRATKSSGLTTMPSPPRAGQLLPPARSPPPRSPGRSRRRPGTASRAAAPGRPRQTVGQRLHVPDVVPVRVDAALASPAGGTAPAAGRSSDVDRPAVAPVGVDVARRRVRARSRVARQQVRRRRRPRAGRRVERGDRRRQRRPARPRRRRRTAGAAAPAPWPTTASARSRGRPSRCRARPRARRASSAARTRSSSARLQVAGRRRTAGRCGCRRCRARSSVDAEPRAAPPPRRGRRPRPPASPCASPRRRPARRPRLR